MWKTSEYFWDGPNMTTSIQRTCSSVIEWTCSHDSSIWSTMEISTQRTNWAAKKNGMVVRLVFACFSSVTHLTAVAPDIYFNTVICICFHHSWTWSYIIKAAIWLRLYVFDWIDEDYFIILLQVYLFMIYLSLEVMQTQYMHKNIFFCPKHFKVKQLCNNS